MSALNKAGTIIHDNTTERNLACTKTGPPDYSIETESSSQEDTIKRNSARTTTGPFNGLIASKYDRAQHETTTQDDTADNNPARINTDHIDFSIESKAAHMQTGRATRYGSIESYLARTKAGPTKVAIGRKAAQSHTRINTYSTDSYLNQATESKTASTRDGITTQYGPIESNLAPTTTGDFMSTAENHFAWTQSETVEYTDPLEGKLAQPIAGLDIGTIECRRVRSLTGVVTNHDSTERNGGPKATAPTNWTKDSEGTQRHPGTIKHINTNESNEAYMATRRLDDPTEYTRDRAQDRTSTHYGSMETRRLNCSTESRAAPSQSGPNNDYDTAKNTRARTATGHLDGSSGWEGALTQAGTTTHHGTAVTASAVNSAGKATADNPNESTSARTSDGTTESAPTETSAEKDADVCSTRSTLARIKAGPTDNAKGETIALISPAATTENSSTDSPSELTTGKDAVIKMERTLKGTSAEKATDDSTIAGNLARIKAGIYDNTIERAVAQTLDGATIDNNLIDGTLAIPTDKSVDGASENTPAETPEDEATYDSSTENTLARTSAEPVDSTTESSLAPISATKG
ncbi:MAG: hypothetical protein KVP17_005357, partial [Porospora cf. gigantea B]|uniref:uncharacterized protein n=1 Tax=Porospora cf. gigantea B TaxID=2853592 RepID=UPI003571CC4B